MPFSPLVSHQLRKRDEGSKASGLGFPEDHHRGDRLPLKHTVGREAERRKRDECRGKKRDGCKEIDNVRREKEEEEEDKDRQRDKEKGEKERV